MQETRSDPRLRRGGEGDGETRGRGDAGRGGKRKIE
jgi:hypothetical protein